MRLVKHFHGTGHPGETWTARTENWLRTRLPSHGSAHYPSYPSPRIYMICGHRDSGSAYCSQHILETDVISDENADLNRVAVRLCSSAPPPHSTTQLSEPFSCTLHLGSVSSSGFHTNQPLQTATNKFSDKETSFPVGVVHDIIVVENLEA